MSSKWNEMFSKIQEDIKKSETVETEKAELHSAESVEVPVEFADAAPVLFEEHSYAGRRAEQQSEEDSALKKLQITQIYRKLTGDARPKLNNGGKNELLIFCPASGHNNTSSEAAWMNVNKNTWTCAVCDNGGGIIDMVAAANGMTFGKASKGKDFAKAKQLTLEKFCGWTFERDKLGYVGKSPAKKKQEIEAFEAEFGKLPDTDDDDEESHRVAQVTKPAGMDYAEGDEDLPSIGPTKFSTKDFGVTQPGTPAAQTKVEPTPIKKPEPTRLEAKPSSLASVTAIRPVETEDEDHDDNEVLPEIGGVFDHLPKGTPVYEFMWATKDVSYPKEFMLFRALQLVAAAAGPYVRGALNSTNTFKPSISCLYVAGSGVGKSQSFNYISEIAEHDAFKWRVLSASTGSYQLHSGVKLIKEVGSGEYLIKQLSQHESESGPQKIRDVVALAEFDEMASIMSKAAIKGSSLLTTIQRLENSGKVTHTVSTGSMSSGELSAVNPNPIIAMGTQPSVMSKILGGGNINNGFVARFDIVTGNPIIEEDEFNKPRVNLNHAAALYGDLATKYLNGGDQEKRDLVYIHFAPECEKEFNRINVKMQKLKATSDVKSRFDLKFRKYCLLFALNADRDQIIPADLRAAEWIMEYLDRTATMTNAKTVNTEGNEMEEGILRAIAKASAYQGKGYATMGQIWLRSQGARKGWDKDALVKRVERLIDRGDVAVDPKTASRGPSSQRFLLPQSSKHLQEAIAHENERTGQ
ncbi:putative primase [Tsukamurella phage TIN4]|uniref:Putative primase n=2 Tax=Tinduovirus TIN3 TaxID=1982571 RepID=A0A0K0N5M3_9CAUD|nr:helicase [Tsukamurella phage TIN3]YP_009604234.1 helicase [Tsukamurella phage TIN4]AKJ71901.1 putative primase [Tsukamurella phage TIN3]AKJ72010.1 putative primase [Tsukamurella phage TIN4]